MFLERSEAEGRFGNSPESCEGVSDAEAHWFAGAFEIGGTICFRTTNRLNKNGSFSSYACPELILRDTNKGLIEFIFSRYGGSIQHRGPSNVWSLSGYKAADIIVAMKPYIVTRSEMLTAVERWLEADREERVEIAMEMRGYDRYRLAQVDDYLHLVDDPNFIAGVIDNRGIIRPTSDLTPGVAYPTIVINGANKALLDSLKTRYEGFVELIDKAGKEVTIRGHRCITKRDSYSLVIQHEHARKLIRLVENHLHISVYQGWDRLIKPELEAALINRNFEIINKIITEYEAFGRGEIHRLTNNLELANTYFLSKNQLGRVLRLLPEPIRKERQQIIQQHTRTHEASPLDMTIFTSIQAELNSYLVDRNQKLRSNHELASEFGVGIDYLVKHILSLLEMDIRKTRATALRSQWTREHNRQRWSPPHSIGGVLFP